MAKGRKIFFLLKQPSGEKAKATATGRNLRCRFRRAIAPRLFACALEDDLRHVGFDCTRRIG
jgi:hypothetical protein